MATRSISPREGRPVPSGGPYEGAPAHLRDALVNWFEDLFTSMEDFTERVTYDNGGMLALATAARINLYQSPRDRFLLNQIIDEANGRDGEELLDLIHYALQPTNPGPFPVNALNQLLIDGGSVWNATPTGLQRRVDPPVQAAFEAASSPHDVASTELEEAWRNTYGRHPDASDAWDHAIKAVEAILIPIILPNQDKPTLGQVVGHLKTQGRQ